MSTTRVALIFFCLVLATIPANAAATAHTAPKSLTNADIVKMVHSKLPESVIVNAIKSHHGNYDTSPDALIKLHNSGVTAAEMDAIMAKTGTGSSASEAASSAPPAPPSHKSHLPLVALSQNGGWQKLPMEKTQLAETKTKPSSMRSLASDSLVTQSMQAGVNTATTEAEMRMSSTLGSAGVQQAGGVFSSIMAQRKPSVTYVWGVPNPASANVLRTDKPMFSVDFSGVRNANPDDFAPVIVKLTPAQNTCRIIGASQGKQDARSSAAADWEIYSHFLEERVAVHAQKLGTGKYEISPASELEPGEYGLVLRPISKSKKFSGGDVARAQGEGLMFDAVWTFQVPEDEQ